MIAQQWHVIKCNQQGQWHIVEHSQPNITCTIAKTYLDAVNQCKTLNQNILDERIRQKIVKQLFISEYDQTLEQLLKVKDFQFRSVDNFAKMACNLLMIPNKYLNYIQNL